MRPQILNVEIKHGVARVTLNRPEVRNAFDDALIGLLMKAFLDIESDKSVRVVVLAGNGPAFCAGADLNWMKRMAGYGYEENLADRKSTRLNSSHITISYAVFCLKRKKKKITKKTNESTKKPHINN